MKWLVGLIAVVLAGVGGFYGAGLVSQPEEPQAVVHELAYANNILTHFEAHLEKKKEFLKKSLEKAGRAAYHEREFALAFFVDKRTASPVVRSMAKRYGELLGLSFVQLNNSAITYSTFGAVPELVIPYHGVNKARNTQVTVTAGGGVLLQQAVRFPVGERKISLALTGGVRLSDAELGAFAQDLGVHLIAEKEGEILLNTLSEELVTFGAPSEGKIIVNNSERVAAHRIFADSVSLYCFTR